MSGSSNTLSSDSLKTLLDHALYYHRIGLSVIPLMKKEKKPLIPWKKYMETRPTQEEIQKWFSHDHNIGIVTGKVSNLLVIDFDDEKAFHEFIERLKNASHTLQLALDDTWIVKTGKGYHIYVRLENLDDMPRTKPRLRAGVDIKAEGGYVVAPPSIHPSGKRYEWVEAAGKRYGPPDIPEPCTLTEREFRELMRLIKPESNGQAIEPVERETKKLGEKEILEIVSMLRGAYREGSRDYIVFFLTGWLRKAGVDYESARRIVELLAENDEEYDHRIYVLDRTYGLRGTPPSPSEMRGKTGLLEILEETYGEQRALDIIRRIEEILGVISPWRDIIAAILDYERQYYVIANRRRKIIVRARRRDDGMHYREIICLGVPRKLTIYVNPLGGITKYEVIWETRTRPKPLVIGPTDFESIIDRLKAEGLVTNRRLVHDALSRLFDAYIERGEAELKEEIDSPGFYWMDGKIITVRYEVREPSHEDVREALKLLDELAVKWFASARGKFSKIIRWGVVSPFIYIYKQKGKWVPWLYLYGASGTGKTTLSEIILSIWGLGPLNRKSGAAIDTPARLGHVLSTTTFPVAVNEPGNAIMREDVVEMMKNAIETTIARGKYVRGTYTNIQALAPLIFTSNKTLPRDDALARRLIVITFTYGERIKPDKIQEFEQEIKPRLGKLAAIGQAIAYIVVNNPQTLEMEWEKLGKALLAYLYKEYIGEIPEWLDDDYQQTTNIYEEMIEQIRNYLLSRINETYTRHISRINSENDPLSTRIRKIVENNLIGWMTYKDEHIVLTTGLAHELRKIIGDIGGLKSIAELLGWEYKRGVKIGNKTVQAILVSFKDFKEFLSI